jgi:hypothetical protein
MNELLDDATGVYVVTTESDSKYWLDLDQRLVRRVTSLFSPETLQLREDGHLVDLLEIITCRLGQPILLMINLNVPNVWLTTRESTPVVRIDAVPARLARA